MGTAAVVIPRLQRLRSVRLPSFAVPLPSGQDSFLPFCINIPLHPLLQQMDSLTWNFNQALSSSTSSDSYPNKEQRADWFVVAGFQVHVTAVPELINVPPSPKDAVAPGWHTTLPTADIYKSPGNQTALLPI